MKPTHLLITAVGITLFPLSVSAQSGPNDPEVQGFLGGGFGYYWFRDDDHPETEDRVSDERTAWRAFAGAEFNRVFSLRSDYIDFGTVEDGNASHEADGWSLSASAALPVTEFFAPYAKVGQLFWDREQSFGPFSSSDSGNDTFYGFGTRFTLSDHVDLRLEWERYTMDDTDIDLGSASLQYRF